MFIITAFRRHKTPGCRLHSFTALLTAVHIRVKDFEQFGAGSACSCHAYTLTYIRAHRSSPYRCTFPFGVFSSDLWSLYCPGNFATTRRVYLAFQKPVLRVGMKTRVDDPENSGERKPVDSLPFTLSRRTLPAKFLRDFRRTFSLLKRPSTGRVRAAPCFHDYRTRVGGFLTDETEVSRCRKFRGSITRDSPESIRPRVKRTIPTSFRIAIVRRIDFTARPVSAE